MVACGINLGEVLQQYFITAGNLYEYDISSLVHPGTNRICIRIDNRMIVPVGVNSHSVSDHTQSNWNGIVGAISLEARSQIHITNIQVFPELSSKSARLHVYLENPIGSAFEGTLELEAMSFNSNRSHQPGAITIAGAHQRPGLAHPGPRRAAGGELHSPRRTGP